MGRGKRKKKLRGHFCWVCERLRPNERFSRKGRRRHVCLECGKLGQDELAYRQHLRDMERCLSPGGGVRRRQRAVFDRFLRHEDPRVRFAAEEIVRVYEAQREQARAWVAADDAWVEAAARGEVDPWDTELRRDAALGEPAAGAAWAPCRVSGGPWDAERWDPAPWDAEPWNVDPWGDEPWGEEPSGEEPSGEGRWCRVQGDPEPAGGGAGGGR